ncbi:unnamed protein product, partial [Prorocentrum cordatum]
VALETLDERLLREADESLEARSRLEPSANLQAAGSTAPQAPRAERHGDGAGARAALRGGHAGTGSATRFSASELQDLRDRLEIEEKVFVPTHASPSVFMDGDGLGASPVTEDSGSNAA